VGGGRLLGVVSVFVDGGGAAGYGGGSFSFIALVLGIVLMPETLRTGSSARQRRRVFDWESTRRVLRTPAVGILVITFFFATFAFGGLESTLALVNRILLSGEELSREARDRALSREAARTSERTNFLVFAYVGFVLMLTQGLVYRRLVAKVGEVRFLRAGMALLTVGLAGAVAVLLAKQPHEQSLLLCCSALAVMSVAVIGFALLT